MGGHAHHSGHTPHVEAHADDWHHHDLKVEGVPQAEHGGIASTASIFKWFVAICVAVVIVVVGISMYAVSDITKMKAAQIERNAGLRLAKEANEYKAAARNTLSTTAGVGEKGYRITIDQAMNKVVKSYAR